MGLPNWVIHYVTCFQRNFVSSSERRASFLETLMRLFPVTQVTPTYEPMPAVDYRKDRGASNIEIPRYQPLRL